MIEPALLYVIRRGVREAEAAGARAIVFVMDTPGGTVDAAGEIFRTIQGLKIPSYTFVENHAFSAGAIIALATKHIYMAPGSIIGDAMPILMTPFGGVQEMSDDMKEKSVAAVAAIIRTAAEAGGHNKELAEKMVRRELEFKIDDKVISSTGQLLTLTNVEAERPVGDPPQPLLSSGTVEDLNALMERLGLTGAEIRSLEITSAERVARFIAALAPLFLIGGLLGIYIEIKTPGFGLPGVLGIMSLAIFFWGHHIAGLAGMEEVIIFAIGMALLAVELFLIPGFGAVGIAGIVLILWAMLSAMIQRYPGAPWLPAWGQVQGPLLKLSAALIGTAVAAALFARLLPTSPLFSRLVLAKATRHSEGFAASDDTRSLVGLTGTALMALRPAGTAQFGERRIDVVTNGEYIDAGSNVRIVESHGSRMVVEAIERGSSSGV
jgi:membrane-bound serine protease (ClpP class)